MTLLSKRLLPVFEHGSICTEIESFTLGSSTWRLIGLERRGKTLYTTSMIRYDSDYHYF